ncbi:hypothetical protein DPMN_188610 [Dreissena polymorpha]|uniref:Uncharacterized protein n=1 Tax=Dreissena polymorpha TaxID=45954 RepID=A0A9D4IA33_DREPO|nr:hypothetical protein DPMN_188610 [Dreissena polymorpha]
MPVEWQVKPVACRVRQEGPLVKLADGLARQVEQLVALNPGWPGQALISKNSSGWYRKWQRACKGAQLVDLLRRRSTCLESSLPLETRSQEAT